MSTQPESWVDRLRRTTTLHRGTRLTVRFAVFEDGSSPAREFLVDLSLRKRTAPKATDLVNLLMHIADNGTHPKYKTWIPSQDPSCRELRQVASGDYRLTLIEDHSEGCRELIVLYGFEKHTKKTSASDANEILRLRRQYQREKAQ